MKKKDIELTTKRIQELFQQIADMEGVELFAIAAVGPTGIRDGVCAVSGNPVTVAGAVMASAERDPTCKFILDVINEWGVPVLRSMESDDLLTNNEQTK